MKENLFPKGFSLLCIHSTFKRIKSSVTEGCFLVIMYVSNEVQLFVLVYKHNLHIYLVYFQILTMSSRFLACESGYNQSQRMYAFQAIFTLWNKYHKQLDKESRTKNAYILRRKNENRGEGKTRGIRIIQCCPRDETELFFIYN